jgi:hypothetical protein
MANKRSIKNGIHVICKSVLAECVAVALYGPEKHAKAAEDCANAVVKLEDHYLRRVSHPEPGMKPKVYYRDLRTQFTKEINELLDHLSS